MGEIVPLPWAECDVARALAREAWRASRPWLDRLADLERAGRARIAAGDLRGGLDVILTIARLDPPLRAKPHVRRALCLVRTEAADAVLAAALARRCADRKARR